MKKQIVTASTRFSPAAKRVIADMRQLGNSIDALYEANEEEYDALDLSALDDELRASLMFAAHTVR